MLGEDIEELEARMTELQVRARRAAAAGDRATAAALKAQVREAQYRWEAALERLSEPVVPAMRPLAPLLPVREQVHQVLTLLTVPSAPKLITAVFEAFFAGGMTGTQMTSLRRDEERSFRAAPHARPYYICSALTAGGLNAARGLLAVSAWPMDRRIVGSLSPRVDFLTAAIRIAEHVEVAAEVSPQATRLLWRFATNIPGAAGSFGSGEPRSVIAAARAELEVHDDEDRRQRRASAERARLLDEVQQLFGAPQLGVARASSIE